MTPTGALLFADESKARAYVMAAAAIPPSSADHVRRELRGLLMPGQTSLHFRSESDSRRRQILDLVERQGWSAHLIVALPKNQRDARDACLRHLVSLAAELRSARLVLETDDSLVEQDKRLLYAACRAGLLQEAFDHRQMRRREEPCLWVPDAVAWCYARGGLWRSRVLRLVTSLATVG